MSGGRKFLLALVLAAYSAGAVEVVKLSFLMDVERIDLRNIAAVPIGATFASGDGFTIPTGCMLLPPPQRRLAILRPERQGWINENPPSNDGRCAAGEDDDMLLLMSAILC